MKNFKKIIIKQGTPGKLSETGAYGYWYPGSDSYYNTEVTKEVEAEHLHLWKNQGEWLAFKVPSKSVATKVQDAGEFVCVWFREHDIIRKFLGP